MTETNDTNNANNISVLKPDSRPVSKIGAGCKGCNGPTKKFQTWCKPCIEKHFQENFSKWTSGNELLDEFIRTVQMEEYRFNFTIEWIPFDRLSDIEFIKKGGFGTISKAIWLDGYIHEWDLKQNEWKRAGRKNVCLKRINDSKDNISMEFLDGIKKQVKTKSSRVITIYGFTQDPESKDYMIVTQYSSEGSLREFLNKNYTNLSLFEKLCILKDISCALKDLQKESRLHQNLHPGNIIMIERMQVATPGLSDLGICKPIKFYKSPSSPSGDKIPVYGVLPYVAPELLFDSKYSQESDIYSFGIIMYEVLTGIPPYYDISHDGSLASKIVEGQRPEIKDNQLPPLLLDLMKECWDKDPNNRPVAQEIFSSLYGMEKNYNEKDSKIYNQIKDIIDIDSSSPPLKDEIDPFAIYTSRLLDFNDLPRPIINQDNEQSLIEDVNEKEEKEHTRCCKACVIC